MRRRLFMALAAATALFAFGGPISSAAAGTTVVHVSTTDMGAKVDPAGGIGLSLNGDKSKATMAMLAVPNTVRAGKVKFIVSNKSGDTVHEMIVAPVADPTKPLDYVQAEDRVNEEAAGHLGEVSELEPGKSWTLEVDLKPGTYILYCNIPKHYMAGMWTLLTVTP